MSEETVKQSELLKQVPDRYAMILTVATRTRELVDGAPKMTRYEHVDDLAVAAKEVATGLVIPTKARKELFKKEC